MTIIWCMVPEIWSVTDGERFLSFGTIFCLFTPLKTRKIKILKKWKKSWRYYHFYKIVPKIMIIYCTVPEIWRVTDVIVIFHFRLFFAHLPLNNSKNSVTYFFSKKLLKNWNVHKSDLLYPYSMKFWSQIATASINPCSSLKL